MLGHALTARLPGHGVDLADVRDAHRLEPGASPYSTASIARWSADRVEVLVLGDSPAVLGPASFVVTDERLAATAPDERAAYREHLAHGYGFDARFAELIGEVQRRERASFNRPGGFWVAEADPAAAAHAIRHSAPAAGVRTVALMSDGAAAGVGDYGLAGRADLLATDPATWLHDVHRAEAADPDGRRWPRTKRHDDKSMVVLRRI